MALMAGAVVGAFTYHATVMLGDSAIVEESVLTEQRARIEMLEAENRQLTEDLFATSAPTLPQFDSSDFPYDENADAHAEVSDARTLAAQDAKILMVTFGANWCVDCRTLHKHLGSEEVSTYTKDRFIFVNVDVGKFNRNAQVAAELGVSLARGIPVAIFYDQRGGRIGTTNGGELEPSRYYTSKQILKFVKDIAERSRVLAPDAVQ
jgi:thioredoxin 1